jgi:hypothetical protein
MQRNQRMNEFSEQEKLFVSLADGITNTMLQLALLSEQGSAASATSQTERWQAVHDVSWASLQLLEGYTLTMRLQGGTAEPELEPVAVASLLNDTLHLLEPYAKQMQVSIVLDMPARLQPVITDRAILQSALLSLGHVFITAQSECDAAAKTVQISAHKGSHGVVAGWYGHGVQLTSQALRRARRLGGWAQQPYGELVSGPASGVFIADSLLSTVSTRLHVARYHNASGLAATLPACRQLQLV